MNIEHQKRMAMLGACMACLMLTPLSVTGQVIRQQSDGEKTQSPTRHERQALRQKLQDIVIPEINFDAAKVTDVIKFLRKKSVELDPEDEGVNFLLRLHKDRQPGQVTGQKGEKKSTPPPGESGRFDGFKGKDFEDFDTKGDSGSETQGPEAEAEADREGPRITMEMRNVPLGKLIKYICMAANLQYAVNTHAVIIASKDVALEQMETRVYPVKAGALSRGGGDRGVKFIGDDDDDDDDDFFE